MKIELLQGSLPITENPGLDSTDPRFDEIATLSQAGQHEAAAALSEAFMENGIYDIRLICFFLFGYWLENGMANILPLIDGLNNVILTNWPAIGPVSSRNKSLEKSLDWLFRQILKKIQYEENKKTPLWQQWQASANTLEIDRILNASEKLRLGIDQQLEENAEAIIAQWSKVENSLVTLYRIANTLPEPQPVDLEQQANNEKLENATTPPSTIDNPVFTTDISYPMTLLLKKLAAFEQVIQENKFSQAALLAEDINQSLANFDPKQYFPKLFETFVRMQAVNFDALSAYGGLQQDPQWLAMQEWLKVDLESFIKH